MRSVKRFVATTPEAHLMSAPGHLLRRLFQAAIAAADPSFSLARLFRAPLAGARLW